MNTKTCRHFNGIHGPGMRKDHVQCTVGQTVNDYREHNGYMNVWGCINGNACKSKCPKFDPYTKAECDADDAETEARIKIVVAAYRSIPSTGSSGIVECVKCKGKLHWSRAACNGHIHAKCETDDCLSWME